MRNILKSLRRHRQTVIEYLLAVSSVFAFLLIGVGVIVFWMGLQS